MINQLGEFVEQSFKSSRDILVRNLRSLPLSNEAQSYLTEIERDLHQDFKPHAGTYYSHDVFEAVVSKAFSLLYEKIKAQPAQIGFEVLRDKWREVVVDYHTAGHWGFVGQSKSQRRF